VKRWHDGSATASGDDSPVPIEDREEPASVAGSNVGQAAAWDGEDGEHWARYEARYDATVRRHHVRLLQAARLEPTDRVLDIGCGCGESTRSAARLAPSGSARGVDLSRAMLERARRRARDEELTNVRFEWADAQVHPFEEHAFEVAISRFGASFFGEPIPAFRNIGRALRPGGRIAMVSWQPFAKNGWLHAIRGALAVGRALPEPPQGVPGPFGLADAPAVRATLAEAGFDDADLEALEEPVDLGANGGDAFGFVRELGFTRGLLADLDERSAGLALDRLRAVLVAHDTGAGVLLPSSSWLITARRP
jgi:SAM-dependent methyltransferase